MVDVSAETEAMVSIWELIFGVLVQMSANHGKHKYSGEYRNVNWIE